MAIYNRASLILACASLLMLNACASRTAPMGAQTEEGLTVSQIYHQSIEESAKSWTAPHYQIKPTDYDGYTRTAANETKALFKPLDNPAIPIYIYPHVALIGDEQLLKPGYTTAFFLYKQNQFALASELY